MLAAWLCQAPAASAPARQPSTADSFLELMADPEIAAIIARHAPAYLRLIEQQVTPPPSASVTLDDFARIPETGVTPATLKAINADLARLPARPAITNNRQ